jgi:hypothetical protein
MSTKNLLPHVYTSERIVNGRQTCRFCYGTAAENEVIAPQGCDKRPKESGGPPTREELVEFIRCICEGDVPIGSGGKVHGTRAIELAAWEFYRRLQEAHEL